MLIALSGRAGVGKDTVAGFILEWAQERGIPARREGFADRLKLSAARVFFPDIGLEDAISWCNRVKLNGSVSSIFERDDGSRGFAQMSGRTFLQRYGTEAHREVFSPDFWIDAVTSTHKEDEILVIPDCRFENEARAVLALHGEVWRVQRFSVSSTDSHVSEASFSSHLVSSNLVNLGTLDDLRFVVRQKFSRLARVQDLLMKIEKSKSPRK